VPWMQSESSSRAPHQLECGPRPNTDKISGGVLYVGKASSLHHRVNG
jgi:hypothetical protein